MGVQKMLEEQQVPGRVHLQVVRELATRIKQHEKTLRDAVERDEKYLKELRSYARVFNLYEKELVRAQSWKPKDGKDGAKGERGETGRAGSNGKDGNSPNIEQIVSIVLGRIHDEETQEGPEEPLNIEKLFTEFIERIHKEKLIKTSALGDMDTFLFNIRSTGKNKRYGVHELMRGAGGTSSGSSANVVTQYNLASKTQVGSDVVVPLSQLTNFATFSNVIAAMRDQIPQTNGLTCTITATDVTFKNADVNEIFSITYAFS